MPLETSRRNFLAHAAATAAAFPLAQSVEAREQKKFGPNDKIRVAAIGLGIMGNKDCATALQIPGVELVAVCDLYSGRLDAAKEKYGRDIAATKDYRAILERTDIDAVIVATCDRWHSPIASEAMRKGKAVYCEKPIVRDLGEGLGVVQTQQQTGALMQVGSQRVSSIAYAKAGEQYRAGAIGKLNCISATYDRQSALGRMGIHHATRCFTANRRLGSVYRGRPRPCHMTIKSFFGGAIIANSAPAWPATCSST